MLLNATKKKNTLVVSLNGRGDKWLEGSISYTEEK
jgi:tryptophan synthase beta subunit